MLPFRRYLPHTVDADTPAVTRVVTLMRMAV